MIVHTNCLFVDMPVSYSRMFIVTSNPPLIKSKLCHDVDVNYHQFVEIKPLQECIRRKEREHNEKKRERRSSIARPHT